MKTSAAFLVLCGLIPCLFTTAGQAQLAPAGSQSQQPPRSRGTREGEAELMSAIRARLDAVARNDTAAWARYVADDMVGPLEGSLPSKQAWLRMHQSWPPEVKYYYGPMEDFKVRLHGDTAIVTYRAKQFNEIAGQTTFTTKWQVETHMWQHGRWQLVSVADCTLPVEPAVASIDPGIYDAYVGQYQWAPTLVSDITRVGDKLIERFLGEDQELLPENQTTFFIKGEAASGDSSRVIFIKDANGIVTHYIYREMGGTDRIVKKVK